MSMQSAAMRDSVCERTASLAGASLLAILCLVLLLAAPGKVVNGLLLGSMIAIGAIGITLIYSILRFAHIAHGDYMTLGAYITLIPSDGRLLPARGHRRRGFRSLHLRLPTADCAPHYRRRLLRHRHCHRLFGL